jgi:hypothetical protein
MQSASVFAGDHQARDSKSNNYSSGIDLKIDYASALACAPGSPAGALSTSFTAASTE